MKKSIFLFCFSLVFLCYGFSQNNLTPDQIRRHANELGIPYEALQRLLDSHRVQTRLSNPNAKGAQLLTVPEINFMVAAERLRIGSYYRIRAPFQFQDGLKVFFQDIEPPYLSLAVSSSFLVNLPLNTVVDALFGVRAKEWGGQELFLVEIALAQ